MIKRNDDNLNNESFQSCKNMNNCDLLVQNGMVNVNNTKENLDCLMKSNKYKNTYRSFKQDSI